MKPHINSPPLSSTVTADSATMANVPKKPSLLAASPTRNHGRDEGETSRESEEEEAQVALGCVDPTVLLKWEINAGEIK